jgi:DNA ligase (NAD+)
MPTRKVKEHLAISATEKAQSLREELAYHEHRYHVLEYPLISTKRYWEMRGELEALERTGEVPVAPDSASLRAGLSDRTGFEFFPHRPPWRDAPTLRSPAELRRYYDQIAQRESTSPVFSAGARLTGVEIALTYVGGALSRAVLRGNGREGEDVIHAARTIGSIPLVLRPPGTITESRVSKLTKQALGPSTMTPVPPFPDELTVRGIVTMRVLDLFALDRRRIDAGEPPYVDAHAAIACSLRRLDPRITAARRLLFFAYSIAKAPAGIDSHWQLLGSLKSWGFRVMPLAWRCVGLDEVLDFVNAIQQAKPTFEYPIDGGVLTLSRLLEEEVSGPPRTMFLAFSSVGRRARVPNVYRAVGRGGSLLPVALLTKVKDGDPPVPEGAPIPAASGTELLDVRAASLVRVIPGPVAPQLLLEGSPEDRAPPLGAGTCPACQQPLVLPEDEPFARCEQPSCKGRRRSRVLHLIGPRGLALSSLNPRVAEPLIGGGIPLLDLFRLEPSAVDRLAPGTGEAFRQERMRLKRLPLWRVLYLSAIPDIGERVSRAIAAYVQDVEGLLALRPSTPIPGLPPEAEASLARWLEHEGREIFTGLAQAGVEIVGEEEVYSSPLLGRSVVIAGRLERMTIDQAVDEIERRGGRVEARVSRRTDFLVAGKDAAEAVGSADAYNVLVIDEQSLAGLIRLS